MQKLSTGKITLLIILGILVILVLWIISTYNTLIRMSENIKTQQAQVEVQYQRRFDLIPNLIESVKGILTQEQEVFGMIAEARTQYAQAASGSSEKVKAMNALETGLGRLLVIVENYPQLRSTENVAMLMDELAGTENRISVERKRYNDFVNVYNQKIRFFPSNIIASAFGFSDRERFEAKEEAKLPPKVDLEVK